MEKNESVKAQKPKSLFFLSEDILGIIPYQIRIEFDERQLREVEFTYNMQDFEANLKIDLQKNILSLKYKYDEEAFYQHWHKEILVFKVKNEVLTHYLNEWFEKSKQTLLEFYDKAKNEEYAYELDDSEKAIAKEILKELIASIVLVRENCFLKEVLRKFESDKVLNLIDEIGI